jgi:uncharacterized protein (TIGR02646 family)
MIGVKRSPEVPAILAHSRAKDRYRSQEVVDRLVADFHNKCYVCEIAPLQGIDVEHLRPHKGGSYPDRMFDWNNLFLSCPHCNKTKAKQKYDEGIIDCCVRDPEALLEQNLIENEVSVNVLVEDDREATLTAELIEEVFMSDNPPIRGYEADMRLRELQKRMNLLYKNLAAYKKNQSDRFAKKTLVALLRPESAFAGFVRCYVRRHLSDYPELAPYVAHGERLKEETH